MSVAEILSSAKAKLGPSGDLLGCELLLSHVLRQRREDFFAHPERELSDEEDRQARALFQRFFDGEPVAYLTHSKEFFGLEFYVDERVLIPRPETELLVGKILEYAGNCDDARALRILDVGTGSGCIAISLAKHIPFARFTALDISAEALEVARMNADRHGVAQVIEFQQSDLLEALPSDSQFEIIVANLPYIGTTKYNFVSSSVERYEPQVALFGGEDGLTLYEKLFQQVLERAISFEMLAGEFGFLQTDALRALIQKYFPRHRLEISQDYAKIERVFVISRLF